MTKDKGESLLGLHVQPLADFKRELDEELDADRDGAYAGIGPLAVTQAQVRLHRELSPFQPPEVRQARQADQQPWDNFAAGQPLNTKPDAPAEHQAPSH